MSGQCNQLPSWLAGPARRTTLRFSNLFQSGVDVLMRRLAILGFLAALAVTAVGSPAAQETADRIVAPAGNGSILWSNVRTFRPYQHFVHAYSETDGRIPAPLCIP